MLQQQYKRINIIVGWCMFLFSATVYWLTAEPTGSFWDCGEFLPCADKLQIAHSPGSPLFLMIGHMFMSLTSNVSKKAVMFNHWSGISVALAATFLFWIITHLAKKLIIKKDEDYTTGNIIAIMASGMVGAATFTFCDSMWFSAVEAIVFATSALFTSLAVWSIIKWDNESTKDYADRWLIFAGFVIGLSIGVHLLSLLTIPAIVFTVYFKNFKPSGWGVVKTFLVAAVITGLIQYALIQGLPKIAAHFDVLFVNSFGLPFNSGVAFFFLLVIAYIVYALLATQGKINAKNVQLVTVAFIITYLTLFFVESALAGLLIGLVLSAIVVFILAGQKRTQFMSNHRLNTVVLTFAFMIIGYSSYVEVVIRASANPPINMSNPNNAFDLVGYLSREQYGTQPFLYGPYFNARAVRAEKGAMQYYKGDKQYEELGPKETPVYDSSKETLFPRLWDSEDPDKVRFYKSYLKSIDPDYKDDETPTFGENISFFVSYQFYYMYWRYFFWDFSGRQNDRQGEGIDDYRNGNWKTGITFFDNLRLGPQDTLPANLDKNKADTSFYLLPLFLGLFGMFYQFNKSKKDGIIVLILFFMTGVGIILWLNQPPLQPRERDYSYLGSFYAYSIWIGLGVISVYELIKQSIKPAGAAVASLAICSIVPVLMGTQGWPSHNRSHRYTARDFGENYLQSCKPNAILFTQGDNDTYPLWYDQEVEGIRTDVRVVNLSLLGVDWYIDEMTHMINTAPAIKLSLSPDKYRADRRDIVYYYDNGNTSRSKYYPIKEVVDFIGNDNNQEDLGYGQKMNFLPTKLLSIAVDKNEVLADGTVDSKDSDNIVDVVKWKLPKSDLLKNDLMTLDIIASNLWARPIYWAISVSNDAYLGLDNYLQQEGLTYRLVPLKKPANDEEGLPGFVNTDRMYDVVMHKFKWGGIDKYNVYLDENVLRMVTNLQSNFSRLASALIDEGKKDSAIQVLDKGIKVLPEKNVPLSYVMMQYVEDYYRAGAPDKAKPIALQLSTMADQDLQYFLTANNQKYQGSYYRDAQDALYALRALPAMTSNVLFEQKPFMDNIDKIKADLGKTDFTKNDLDNYSPSDDALIKTKDRLMISFNKGLTLKDIEAQYKSLADLNKQLTATRNKYRQLYGNSIGNE